MNASRREIVRQFGKAAVAVLLIALVGFSALASRAAVLHQALHSDQQSPAHECLITTFVNGQTDLAPPATTIFLQRGFTIAEPPALLLTRSVSAHLLPDPRGPPSLS